MSVKWRPNGAAIREARERLDWTQEDLSEKSGFSINHISNLELEKVTTTASTLSTLAKTFRKEEKKQAQAAGREDRDSDYPTEKFGSYVPAGSRRQKAARKTRSPNVPRTTLQRLAEIEGEDGAFQVIDTPRGPFELLGPSRYHMLLSRFADLRFKDTRFAVTGRVDLHRGIPEAAQTVLGVLTGEGARFNIVRAVGEEPFYVTVFAKSDKHSTPLMDAWEKARCKPRQDIEVTVLVRVLIARPSGPWQGFFILEKDPKPMHWCLVVDEVVAVRPADARAALRRMP